MASELPLCRSASGHMPLTLEVRTRRRFVSFDSVFRRQEASATFIVTASTLHAGPQRRQSAPSPLAPSPALPPPFSTAPSP
eukprot:5234910-Prymnesium_polylepis.1